MEQKTPLRTKVEGKAVQSTKDSKRNREMDAFEFFKHCVEQTPKDEIDALWDELNNSPNDKSPTVQEVIRTWNPTYQTHKRSTVK
jgi:hypothetical protein